MVLYELKVFTAFQGQRKAFKPLLFHSVASQYHQYMFFACLHNILSINMLEISTLIIVKVVHLSCRAVVFADEKWCSNSHLCCYVTTATVCHNVWIQWIVNKADPMASKKQCGLDSQSLKKNPIWENWVCLPAMNKAFKNRTFKSSSNLIINVQTLIPHQLTSCKNK